MDKVISLSCPKCGGKLDVLPNSISIVCQYCGTENIVQRDGDAVQLEAFARCPKCNRNDRAEKLTAIIVAETREIHGTKTRTEVVIEADGNQRTRTIEVPYTDSQVSALAERLALPEKHPQPPLPPSTASLKMVFAGIISTFLGFFLGLAELITAISPSRADASVDPLSRFVSIAGVVLICAFPLIICGGLLGYYGWARYQVAKAEDEKRRESETEAARKNDLAWQRVVERWNQLYYCSRDDCVFIPGDTHSKPLSEMEQYLYES